MEIEKLTGNLLKRATIDGSKPRRDFAIAKGKLCFKCVYKKHCGDCDSSIRCEMYKPDRAYKGKK